MTYPQEFDRWWLEQGQFMGPAGRCEEPSIKVLLQEQSYFVWCENAQERVEMENKLNEVGDEERRKGYDEAIEENGSDINLGKKVRELVQL